MKILRTNQEWKEKWNEDVLTEEVIVAEETTNEDENFFTQFEKMEIN